MNPGPDDLDFTRLWMQAQPVVASLLTMRLGDRSAVEDVGQEVALAAFAGFADFDRTRPFTGWVVGIAQHKAVDWLRRHGTRRRVISDELALLTLAEVAVGMDRELGDRESALHGCVEVLGGRSRDLVRLHYGEAMPLADTGVRLGLTLANTKMLLHRLRLALRECVERRLAQEQR